MGAGGGPFPGNASLDFALKVADLSGDLGLACGGRTLVDGNRPCLEPVQQTRAICDHGQPCDPHLSEIPHVL